MLAGHVTKNCFHLELSSGRSPAPGWTPAGEMRCRRWYHAMSSVGEDGGTVVLLGGAADGGECAQKAELLERTGGRWRSTSVGKREVGLGKNH